MRVILFLLVAGVIIGFSNCVSVKKHYYYFQDPQQVPQFKEKNEVRLSGYVSSGKDNNGFGFQGAYSLPKNFAIAISGMQFKNSSTSSVNGVNTGEWSGQCFNGALGQYYDFKKYGLFEIYAGYGYGQQVHAYSAIKEEWVNTFFGPLLSQTVTPIGTADFTTSRLYIQPSYGYSFNGIDIAISTRYSYLNYAVTNKVEKGFSEYEEVRTIQNNKNYMLFEPAITFRGGWQYAKMQLQFAFTGDADYIRYSPYTISLGFQIAIAERFWRKEPKDKPALIE